MEWEHAKIAVIQEACKNGYNVNYVVVETDISKIAFPEGSVVESHDAGMYKNEDAYCMISKKCRKGPMRNLRSLSLWRKPLLAEQAKKKQSKPRKKRIKKSAMVKKSRQRPQIKLMLGFAIFLVLF